MENKENKDELKKDNNDEQNVEEKSPPELNIDPEELSNLVKKLKDEYNIEDQNIKIVKLENKKRKKIIPRLNELLFVLFDIMLIFALNGYIKYTSSGIIELLIFTFVFIIVEFLLKLLISTRYQKLILYSFGTIMVPITILSIYIGYLVSNIMFESEMKLIAFLSSFIILRLIIKVVVLRKQIIVIRRGNKE